MSVQRKLPTNQDKENLMARAKPEEPKDRTRQVQLLDLEAHYSSPDGTLLRNKSKIDRGEMCYFASPWDFPAYVRFMRTVVNNKEGTNTSIDHLSTTIEVDCYPAGIKVFVKWDCVKKQFVVMIQEGKEKAEVVRKAPTAIATTRS